MNNQKDNKQNTIENKQVTAYSKDRLSNYYNVFDHAIYKELAERSQKIVTACYMITDFLAPDDALRILVRKEITGVMHSLFTLTHSEKKDRVETLSRVHNILFGNLSYLEIVYHNGFISEMNYRVVVDQIRNLRRDIDVQIKKSLPYDNKNNHNSAVKEFSFSDSFFDVSRTKNDADQKSVNTQGESAVFKDNQISQVAAKKTEPSNTSHNKISQAFVKRDVSLQTLKPAKKFVKTNHAKETRKENILKILKQKRNASINDICALFKDCSSKTIQRDLTDLIEEGMVVKEGSRRWSKYNLNY
jgi:hypothetical protein